MVRICKKTAMIFVFVMKLQVFEPNIALRSPKNMKQKTSNWIPGFDVIINIFGKNWYFSHNPILFSNVCIV
jgi:hypothetical protein